MTHDYKRHGTTDLFAAMNVATGEVLFDTKKSHKATDVLAFFKLIDLHVAQGSRNPRRARQPLRPQGAPRGQVAGGPQAGPLAPAFHADLVVVAEPHRAVVQELTERRLRRGVFTSVAQLIEAIETWAEHWNDDPKPFVWHKQADEIIDKVRRGRAALYPSQIRDEPLARYHARCRAGRTGFRRLVPGPARFQVLQGRPERSGPELPILWTSLRSALCPSQAVTVCHLPPLSWNRPRQTVA